MFGMGNVVQMNGGQSPGLSGQEEGINGMQQVHKIVGLVRRRATVGVYLGVEGWFLALFGLNPFRIGTARVELVPDKGIVILARHLWTAEHKWNQCSPHRVGWRSTWSLLCEWQGA